MGILINFWEGVLSAMAIVSTREALLYFSIVGIRRRKKQPCVMREWVNLAGLQ